MIKRNLNNQQLDSIGKAIFTRESIPATEIDRIVANPQLFAQVTSRIQNTPAASAKTSSIALPTRRYVYAWSGMALAFVTVFGFVALRYYNQTPVKAPVSIAVLNQVPDAVPGKVAGFKVPPQPNTGKLSASPATKYEKDEPRYEQAIVRTVTPRRRPETKPTAAEDKFFPVSYTGDPVEMAGGGQVIRVEMKRSSLFALGVDLPLENDDAVVKADLLVGRDGVTRAVRLVD